MDVDELCDMFPALGRDVIVAHKRRHTTEDALVTALMSLQEEQGGVGARGQPEQKVVPKAAEPFHPVRGTPKVAVAAVGNSCVPIYWASFWSSNASKYAPLQKVNCAVVVVFVCTLHRLTHTQSDAEHALFFDRHFLEVPESEGRQEMGNVLSRLAKHPPNH